MSEVIIVDIDLVIPPFLTGYFVEFTRPFSVSGRVLCC